MAHAKNIAHKLASGGIVCNLDADNIISESYIQNIISLYNSCKKKVIFGSADANNRVVIMKKYFEAIGGYNEELIGGSWFYKDLCKRACKLLKLEKIKLRQFNECIQHSDEERVQNFDPKIMEQALNFDYKDFKLKDEAAMKCRHPYCFASIKYNQWLIDNSLNDCIANKNKEWGSENLIKNFKENIAI
jgi:predicted glycosyltransferase involved in capsule biosynthesis